jgi:energy-converting hydrogenase Eha subunit C
MKKINFAYAILSIGIILLILNIADLDFENFKQGALFGIISNILLIILMIVNIKGLKKIEKEKN